MLVATPGQTSYSIVHNNSSNGSSGNSAAAATSATKKSSAVNSANATASGVAKSLNNNNNHTASTVATKNSVNSNTHTTTFNHHTHLKSDNGVASKISNYKKATASSREVISSTIMAATNHSLKNEKSTNTTNSKQLNFIQTLKDSVQKALISTTGSSGNNSVSNKFSTDNKLQSNCNNSTTSINNVTSSSSSTSHNPNKVSTTTSSNNSTAAAQQSSSSVSAVRSKYFSCSLSKLHTVAPTAIHRYPEERQNAGSTDSLQKEMCHFKPIRIVPKTPWKSGSKSRGNSLRFPKANLATKNTEFVLKSNCDVNNRKKKQQQSQTQNDKINVDEDDVDDNEQENKEFHGIYKPKPSLICLSTSVTTPNHQSAFVCLISEMKNFVSLQSKRQLTPAAKELASIESIEDLYVPQKKKPAKKQQKKPKEHNELPNDRSSRRANGNSSQSATKEHRQQSNAKLSATKVRISKTKSRRNIGRGKSKTNMAARKVPERLRNSLSMPAVVSNGSENVIADRKGTRKRKLAQEAAPLSLGERKSSRLSAKNLSSVANKLYIQSPNNIPAKMSQKLSKNPTTLVRTSPILTRSRLKQLIEQQGKITVSATGNAKKRKI